MSGRGACARCSAWRRGAPQGAPLNLRDETLLELLQPLDARRLQLLQLRDKRQGVSSRAGLTSQTMREPIVVLGNLTH